VVVQRLDPEAAADVTGLEMYFDTVLCVNVLEYLERPEEVLRSLRTAVRPGGDLIVLVPQGPALFGSLDRALGHKRRYRAAEMCELLGGAGFSVEKIYDFNKAGAPPWRIYSTVFHSRHINKLVLKLFDKTVWFWRRIDGLMPWRGLSLIFVARNTGGAPSAASPLREEETAPARSPHEE
jgi:SAM-dependent methyltransferase